MSFYNLPEPSMSFCELPWVKWIINRTQNYAQRSANNWSCLSLIIFSAICRLLHRCLQCITLHPCCRPVLTWLSAALSCMTTIYLAQSGPGKNSSVATIVFMRHCTAVHALLQQTPEVFCSRSQLQETETTPHFIRGFLGSHKMS